MTTTQLVPHAEYMKYIAKLPNEISQFLEDLSNWLKKEKELELSPTQLSLKKVVAKDIDYFETYEVVAPIPEANEIFKEQSIKIVVKD